METKKTNCSKLKAFFDMRQADFQKWIMRDCEQNTHWLYRDNTFLGCLNFALTHTQRMELYKGNLDFEIDTGVRPSGTWLRLYIHKCVLMFNGLEKCL